LDLWAAAAKMAPPEAASIATPARWRLIWRASRGLHQESEGQKCFRDESSVLRAAYCPAVGRPAPGLDFDCENVL
jgi:hypothetical protein